MSPEIRAPQVLYPISNYESAVETPSEQGLVRVNSFTDACRQYLRDHNLTDHNLIDHDQRPQGPGIFVYGMSLLLGHKMTRRLSNLLACTGLAKFYPAQREYPVLSRTHEINEVALKLRPNLFTMSEAQTKDEMLQPKKMYYEILPRKSPKDPYSIVYYIETETEKMPIPVLGRLYTVLRTVLYGSKHDLEAIQIELDPNTKKPIGLNVETSNYSNNPESFDLISSKDMHLFTRVSQISEGTWERTVQQKNGTIQKTKVADPFQGGAGPNLAVVCWNGAFDLYDRVAQNQDLKLYPFETPEPKYLSEDTYRKEGVDLRVGWLTKHKQASLISRTNR